MKLEYQIILKVYQSILLLYITCKIHLNNNKFVFLSRAPPESPST